MSDYVRNRTRRSGTEAVRGALGGKPIAFSDSLSIAAIAQIASKRSVARLQLWFPHVAHRQLRQGPFLTAFLNNRVD